MITVSGKASPVHYSTGYSDGECDGEHDMNERLGAMSDAIAEARHEATQGGRAYRAYWLGYARGYRAVARTFNYGKWGS